MSFLGDPARTGPPVRQVAARACRRGSHLPRGRDLLGSINAEALPEMASRLVTVRLEQHLTDTEQPPNDQRVPRVGLGDGGGGQALPERPPTEAADL